MSNPNRWDRNFFLFMGGFGIVSLVYGAYFRDGAAFIIGVIAVSVAVHHFMTAKNGPR